MNCEHCKQLVKEEDHISIDSCNNSGSGVTLHSWCYENFLFCNKEAMLKELEYWRELYLKSANENIRFKYLIKQLNEV